MKYSILRTSLYGCLFIAVYLILDRLSYIHVTFPVNVTPWNPSAGIGLALLLVYGIRGAPLLLVSMLAADFSVRGWPTPLVPTVMANLSVVIFYSTAAQILRENVRIDHALGGVRHVMWLLGSSLVASALSAYCYVGVFLLAGVLPSSEFWSATGRYWIGDMIGIAVFTPAVLVFMRRADWPPLRIFAEILGLGLGIAATLWMVLIRGAPENFQFFYLLFLPLIWAAVRFGIKGAVLGSMAAQIGVMVVLREESAETVTAFQYLMLALVATTAFLGAAIEERRRVEAILHARQDDLAQVSRLSTAGEMAAVLAHELNQPLLAAIAFTRAAQRMLAGESPDTPKARSTLDRAVAENQRAAEIVRSLRQFIGSGPIARDSCSMSELVADAMALAAPEFSRRGIRLSTQGDKFLPPVQVDRIQIQQVLLNLVRNAMEAIERDGDISVATWVLDGMMAVQVTDSGPGVSEDVESRLFQPFNTSKASGMGLGLAISRSFVETHGGKLWLERTGGGRTAFRFTLPLSK